MNTRTLLIAIAIIILAVIAYLAFADNRTETPGEMATTTENGSETTGTMPPGGVPETGVTITYGPNGFSPASVTVPAGTTVTWVNQSGGRMWVASASHPTHTAYDGTSLSEHCVNGAPEDATVFDQCSDGAAFSFMFNQTGTWNYHNHADSSDFGSVTVTAQ